MRQEAKEVDGPDIERAEKRRRDNELISEDEETIYDLDGKPELAHESGHTTTVVAAMEAILGHQHIAIDELQLPKRELLALEALRAAVDGRDAELHRFVYAEDRRALLEQSLAVLQPEIASMPELGLPFDGLIEQVGNVRIRLGELADAQEGFGKMPVEAKGEEGDTDDKPDPEPEPEAEDTSLTGPERQIEKPPSSLIDPRDAAELNPAGARLEPTTSETKETGEASKPRPWWRRPFGG